MKNLDDFIFEKQLEDAYNNILNEDIINEGIIRNGLRRLWSWIKRKFSRRKNPYMANYIAHNMAHEYDYDYEPTITHAKRSASEINKQQTVNNLLNNDKLRANLDDKGQKLLASELYNKKKKMCGLIIYTPFKLKHKSSFIILGLECTNFKDPELINLIIEMAKHYKCAAPIYIAKSEYMFNKDFYEKSGFELVEKKRQTNLFYAYKEY